MKIQFTLIACSLFLFLKNAPAQIIETLRPPVTQSSEMFVNNKKQKVQSSKPAVLIDPKTVVMQSKWDITLRQHGIDHGSDIPQSRMDSIKQAGNLLKENDDQLLLGKDEEVLVTNGLEVTPTVNTSFKGNAFNGWAPPDNNIAVSDEGYVVSVMNTSLLATDVSGNILYEVNFDDFLSFLELTGLYFDPKVVYDPVEDKFILVLLNGNTPATSTVVIGFSTSGNPNETWWFYTFSGDPAGENLWFDYPSIGISTEDLYVSGNLYTADRNFDQVLIYQIEKGPGFEGESLDGFTWYDVRDANGAPDFTVVPASFGFDGSVGPGIYLVSTIADGGTEAMLYYTDNSALNNPNLYVFKATIPKYYIPFDGIMKGTTDKIKTNDCRTLTAFYADGTVHFAFDTRGDDFHTKIQYCRLNTADLTAETLIYGQQPYEYAYPSIAPFSNSVTDKTVLIGFLRTSGSIYPEFRVFACDNDMNFSNSVLVKEGESFTNYSYENTIERWGDYTGIARRHSANGAEVWVSGCYGEDDDNGEPDILCTWIAQITDGQVSTAPVARFVGNPTEITLGQSVSFSDQSTNAPTSWLWTFPGGNPSTSQLQNPIVSYAASGVYDVKLKVTNGTGQDEEIKSGYIVVTESLEWPIAGFTSDVTDVSPGGVVQFTDISVNQPTDWDWFFEGGVPTISHDQHPIVMYPASGCFDVTLIASNAAGSDVLTRQCYIDVLTAVDEVNDSFEKFIVYPNPVTNSTVSVDFEMQESHELEIVLVDARGMLVKTLLHRRIKEGLTTLSFNSEPLVPGMYYIAVYDESRSLLISKELLVQN